MTRCAWLLAAVILAAAAHSRAQNPFDVTATYTVPSQSRMTFSATTLTFPNADPDQFDKVAATENPITVTVKARFGAGQAFLTVRSNEDLTSDDGDVIPLSALKWTATGDSGFLTGVRTMSRGADLPVATWNGSGHYIGTLTFTLDNLWTYAVGTYRTSLTYTLSTP